MLEHVCAGNIDKWRAMGYGTTLFFHNNSQSGKEVDMDFLNSLLHKIERAHGMYKTLEVITDYFWPVLITLGAVIAILIIRSYLHGRDIKKLKRGAVGNSAQGASIHVHCQTANILQTTPDNMNLLVNGKHPPRMLQASANKIICPHCHAVNTAYANFCMDCRHQIATDEELIAMGLGHKRQSEINKHNRLEEKRGIIQRQFRKPATVVCPRCHSVNEPYANFCSCGYQIAMDEELIAKGLGHRRQSKNESSPKPRPKKKPGLDILD